MNMTGNDQEVAHQVIKSYSQTHNQCIYSFNLEQKKLVAVVDQKHINQ